MTTCLLKSVEMFFSHDDLTKTFHENKILDGRGSETVHKK